MTKRKIEDGVIPPDPDAEFVANLEDVRETDAQAYDPQPPVVCRDEQPVPLLKETQVPIAATKEHGQRVDDEYERNGTASIFLFAEPRTGFRPATARAPRTQVDGAKEVAHWLDTRDADGAQITRFCAPPNPHTKGAFTPKPARASIKRINFCYPPTHGSWLNVAACALSWLTSQCLRGRRLGE